MHSSEIRKTESELFCESQYPSALKHHELYRWPCHHALTKINQKAGGDREGNHMTAVASAESRNVPRSSLVYALMGEKIVEQRLFLSLGAKSLIRSH